MRHELSRDAKDDKNVIEKSIFHRSNEFNNIILSQINSTKEIKRSLSRRNMADYELSDV